jgi:hypothetical protein
MALISLLTDFGLQDEYVGVMKGVIAGIHPKARVVDLSHGIEPQNVAQGAYILAASYAYFPIGSVHVGVVDPGVGGDRRILALEVDGHRFVVPDNGLIEMVLARGLPLTAVSVESPRYVLDRISHTFHGRDIFAPVAAHLATGLPLTELGPAVDADSMVTGVAPRCRFSTSRCVEGQVIAVDRFGNLMTNIGTDAIDRLGLRSDGLGMVVELSDRRIDGLVTAYDQVDRLAPLAIIGSRGLLEISVNGGNAHRCLGAGVADRVRVRLI